MEYVAFVLVYISSLVFIHCRAIVNIAANSIQQRHIPEFKSPETVENVRNRPTVPKPPWRPSRIGSYTEITTRPPEPRTMSSPDNHGYPEESKFGFKGLI